MDFDKVKEGSDYLIKVTKTRPKIGIICGSGVGELVLTYFNVVDVNMTIFYAKQPS